MRKIKLRAWDKVKSEMLFDFFVHSYEQELYWDAAVLYDDMSYAEASRFDLMLYTGLHDKNGKEIFEGDQIRIHGATAKPWEVFWDDEMSRWYARDKKGDTYDNGDYYQGDNMYSATWESSEVIGNIYENPEPMETN